MPDSVPAKKRRLGKDSGTESEDDPDPIDDSCPSSDEFSDVDLGAGSDSDSGDWSSDDQVPLHTLLVDEVHEEEVDDLVLAPGLPQAASTSGSTWSAIQPTSPANFDRFIGNAKVQLQPEDLEEPVDYYLQIVDADMWTLMVEQTNKFAQQTIGSMKLKKKSRLRAWTDTNVDEMRRFVGLLILIGLDSKPRLDLYWSKNDLYGSPLFQRSMKRDRFFLLLRFWHFSDNDLLNPDDRLFKIAPVVDAINRNSLAAMCPGAEVVIDESLIPWRGRLLFRQYIPSKAHKYGVKLYKICSESGYTFKIKIYSGKTDKTAGFGHADEVVRELTTGMLEEGRTVVTDNFYTSLPLARYLLEHKTHLIGTLRANRKELPAEVVKAKLKRGEVTGKQDQRGIKVITWVDKRRVNMLTTIPEHEATLTDTGRLRRGEQVKKPQCVVDYNRLKKGVDLSDQFSSYYSPLRKSLRWYKKLAVRVSDGERVHLVLGGYTKSHAAPNLPRTSCPRADWSSGGTHLTFRPPHQTRHKDQAGSSQAKQKTLHVLL